MLSAVSGVAWSSAAAWLPPRSLLGGGGYVCLMGLLAQRLAGVAVRAGARTVEVGSICTDVEEHRRRVETRKSECRVSPCRIGRP